MIRVRVYDNGDSVADRWNVCISWGGVAQWYAMSDDALSADGVNMCSLPPARAFKDEDEEPERLVDLPKAVLVAIIARIEQPD